jgi:hypothetical protein
MVIGTLVFMMLLALLGIFGPSFGINDNWVVFVGIPGFGVLMFFYMRSKHNTKKPNPHINAELIEKLDRLEKLEELENRPDRDKQIPGFERK